MKVTEIKAWVVYENSRTGYSNLLCYVATKELAEQIRNQNKNCRTYNEYCEKVDIIETIEEYEDIEKSKIRAAALAKLTPAEKAALGF